MGFMPEPRVVVRTYTPTALPSVTARALAFLCIVVGGVCGGLVAYAITDLQCGNGDGPAEAVLAVPRPGPGTSPTGSDDERQRQGQEDGCTTVSGVAGLLGATASAGAFSVIVVLVLRAMGEWRRDLAPGP